MVHHRIAILTVPLTEVSLNSDLCISIVRIIDLMTVQTPYMRPILEISMTKTGNGTNHRSCHILTNMIVIIMVTIRIFFLRKIRARDQEMR